MMKYFVTEKLKKLWKHNSEAHEAENLGLKTFNRRNYYKKIKKLEKFNILKVINKNIYKLKKYKSLKY